MGMAASSVLFDNGGLCGHAVIGGGAELYLFSGQELVILRTLNIPILAREMRSMALPFDYEFLGNGLTPDGNDRVSMYIGTKTLDEVYDEGQAWKVALIDELEDIVTEPAAIFSGLCRDGFEHGFAYSRPCELYPGFVAVAYVHAELATLVFDWELRSIDEMSPGHPAGWQDDFGERTWHAQ